ncbi:TPA: hypothetical protein ACH3X1_004186 [Trebouxia sp. C0004]
MADMCVGALVVALAALNYNGEGKKDKARNAFLVLRCLVSSKSLPSTDTAENMATLLRLQGLRRITGLICPRTYPAATSTDDMQEAWGLYDPASIIVEAEDPELVPQMQFMTQVAQLLVDLVTASALQSGCAAADHRPSWLAQGPNTLEMYSQDPDVRAPESTHASTWPGLCNGFVSPSVAAESWVTPTATAWQERSAVALKALSTLHWLGKPEQLQKLTQETPNPLSSATENYQSCTAAHQAVEESLLRLLHCCMAGHLLDPNLDVRAVVGRALHPLMHNWSSQGDTAKRLTFSILAPMFLRLALDHEELLADEQAVLETAENVVKPQQAALVWQLIVDIIDSSWSSLVEGPAVEALHAIVSHDTYCQKLLESHTVQSHTFPEVLSALVQSAQLTFGACLARLATQYWDLAASKARESTATAKRSAPRGGVESGSRLVPQDVLIMICGCVQEAVLAPLPWDLSKCISLARVLQRMAHLLKQQPLDNISLQEDVQRVVGMNLVKLWEASDQLGLKLQLVLGGLLLTQLAEHHSFESTATATKEQAEELMKLVRAASSHALPHLPSAATPALSSAQTASNIASTSVSASASASASASTSASASASSTASDPPSKAPSSTPTSHGKQTRTAGSAGVSPRRAPSIGVDSESDAPPASSSIHEPGFPEVGLIHTSSQMVQTLMLQCLLPCLSPDHDFGQVLYAPWLHFLVLGAAKLLDKSTEGTQQAALVLKMLPGVELAARMRPDPDSPAFSQAPPLRLAQALLQYLALLLSALRQRHQEARLIQSVALSASRRAERNADVQQQLTSELVAAAVAKELSRAPYREVRGRPVPAGLPLQLKLNEATVKDLVELVVPCVTNMWRKLGWEDIFAEAQRTADRQAQLELKDNIGSICRAQGLPHKTLEDLVLTFRHMLEDASGLDSASAAAAELVAEEEQLATKAAAKKAKKQRQKLKAKKQAQPEPTASAAEPHDARIPSGQAQPLSAESAQLSMDLSQLPPSLGEHQAEDPRAHDLDQQQQQQFDGAERTSLSASSALGAAAAQENNAKAVAAELEALQLPPCDQAANQGHTDADFLQQLFCCPLTKATMVEPTIAADGHTYERSAIQEWLTHSHTSPVTGHPLSHTRLVSNQAARVAIASQLVRVQ